MAGTPFVRMVIRQKPGFASLKPPARSRTGLQAFPSASAQLLSSTGRPTSGLSLEAALERWSDPADYAAMKEYEDASTNVSCALGMEPSPQVLRYREFARRRHILEEAQLGRLRSGRRLVASGIAQFGAFREALHYSLFSVLLISYEFEEIGWNERRYEAVEIFDRAAIPTNLGFIPDWLVPEFQHEDGYRVVIFRGQEFRFTELQSRMIQALHHAALAGHPWVVAKRLVEDIGAGVHFISDLLKANSNLRDLIESDKRGKIRLRISPQ